MHTVLIAFRYSLKKKKKKKGANNLRSKRFKKLDNKSKYLVVTKTASSVLGMESLNGEGGGPKYIKFW